eukprot:5193675-Amphidinium_carterae.2
MPTNVVNDDASPLKGVWPSLRIFSSSDMCRRKKNDSGELSSWLKSQRSVPGSSSSMGLHTATVRK